MRKGMEEGKEMFNFFGMDPLSCLVFASVFASVKEMLPKCKQARCGYFMHLDGRSALAAVEKAKDDPEDIRTFSKASEIKNQNRL
jgi:hypothetical protein